ncbi:rhomboid family intramembrane serine protease [Ruficoccus amylovorans]|uniref:Rhomboid family intramembrane serine protease n=1 Tax=Ruficoccus amylovorans TaxID=1804625 RepID=A0A842HEA6_9BACT|nr:rhomboid family intramembrane serine protease [Ruficoccus amylovorans]MBC2594579.1 rhomboid family intramembrane serine protease [Ruficoccus amylovorans]
MINATNPYESQPATFSRFPPVVKTLLVANVAVFLLMNFSLQVKIPLMKYCALWPVSNPWIFTTHSGWQSPFAPWQMITYGFMHTGFTHLFFNMFAFWMFGSVIERVWGSKRFAFYYFACVFGAAIAQLFVSYGKGYPTIGASGGVFGLLLAYGMMFPRQKLIFIAFPVEARWFVLGYGVVELIMGVTGTMSGVAHFAHLGGMIFGFLLIQFWLGRFPIKPRPGKLF